MITKGKKKTVKKAIKKTIKKTSKKVPKKSTKKLVAKKPRKKRAKKKGGTKLYFNQGTHDAIVVFQTEECDKKRGTIYDNEIRSAFEKLAENLIFIHRFHSDTLPYEVLKNDCVSFLFQTLGKFDHTKGTKAFSYFNVVAKNWLIANSRKDTKRRNLHVSLDNFKNLSAPDRTFIEHYNKEMSPERRIMIRESREELKDILQKIRKRLTSDNETSCMNAIIEVFDRVDDLDFLNKRAVFVYLREISGLNPKQLSISMSNIRKHYRDIIKSDRHNLFFR